MKISIVTPSFNQAAFIEETLLSVINQRYCDLEYLVIDGGSTDGSVEIIEKYRNYLSYYVSEPDDGQVDAINKGMQIATGDICAFINSDDIYLPGTFQLITSYFKDNPQVDWVCGNTIFFGSDITPYYLKARVPTRPVHGLLWEYHSPQPGMFWRRSNVNVDFDSSYNYCFDHDFYMKLLFTGKKCIHINYPVAGYRLHSTSKTFLHQCYFDQEFERIADFYLNRLTFFEKRKVNAVMKIRKVYQSFESNDINVNFAVILISMFKLFRIVFDYPFIVIKRSWWGTLRKAFRLLYTEVAR